MNLSRRRDVLATKCSVCSVYIMLCWEVQMKKVTKIYFSTAQVYGGLGSRRLARNMVLNHKFASSVALVQSVFAIFETDTAQEGSPVLL